MLKISEITLSIKADSFELKKAALLENVVDGVEMKLKTPTVVSSIMKNCLNVNVNEITETIVVSSLDEIDDMPVTLSWNSK